MDTLDWIEETIDGKGYRFIKINPPSVKKITLSMSFPQGVHDTNTQICLFSIGPNRVTEIGFNSIPGSSQFVPYTLSTNFHYSAGCYNRVLWGNDAFGFFATVPDAVINSPVINHYSDYNVVEIVKGGSYRYLRMNRRPYGYVKEEYVPDFLWFGTKNSTTALINISISSISVSNELH